MPELYVHADRNGGAFELIEGKPLFVGRTSQCDIQLPSPAVSRRHAVFLALKGEYGLKDMGSANGTYLNGKRIAAPVRLKNGDVIQIAEYLISFQEQAGKREGEEQSSARSTTIFTAFPLKPPLIAVREGAPGAPVDLAPAPKRKKQPSQRLQERSAAKEGEAEAGVEPTPMTLSPVVPEEAPPEAAAVPESLSEVKAASDTRIRPIGVPDTDVIAAAPAPGEETPGNLDEVTDSYMPGDPVAEQEMRAEAESVEEALPGDAEPPAADDYAIAADEADGDAQAGDDALTKAAAEAGMVGEFAPEPEDNLPADPPAGGGVHLAVTAGGVEDPNAIPIDMDFRQAIETRLMLYSFLHDLQMERQEFLARRPKMADAAKAELARQDREMTKIPTPEQADNMIEKRRAKQKDLIDRIKAAEKSGEPAPPRPTRDMREAEEMAISQWTICAQSAREALPAVYNEGFKLMSAEPLAGILEGAGLPPVMLMGGTAYYMALEVMQEETKLQRQQIRAAMANLPAPGEKKQGRGGMLGFLGRGNAAQAGEAPAEEEGKSHAELAAEDAQAANRAAWIAQELDFMEKALILEFWRLYGEAAQVFIPRHDEMPLAMRAFLRHGAIGFNRWLMKEEVSEHIRRDCAEDVVQHMVVSRKNTNILYADEYLAAVMNLECTPALDENLEINERNSPAWKADKALRRIINSRSQATLLEELLDDLEGRSAKLSDEAADLDDKLSKLLTGMKNYKQVKNELSQKRQAIRVEISKLGNLANKIRTETLASLREGIQETEDRFDGGELPNPSIEFLIDRECKALRKIGRLLANLKERFMPLVLRDNFQLNTDAVNDRPDIGGEFFEMERRDPAIFIETLVPSKKKANRVDLRISPVIVLIPAAGVLAYSWNPRTKPEDGRLAIPTCFIRQRIRERQITYLLADFRWDTSKAAAGMDVMTSDTIVAAFMTVRWDWRKRSKEGREKGLIFNDQNDRTNWRRVYEAYSQTALDGGKKLFNRNYDFYERIIGKYFDMPEGVELLRK